MLLARPSMGLALSNTAVLSRIAPRSLANRLTVDTHASLVEFATEIHYDVGQVARELEQFRSALTRELERIGLAAGVAGTHPSAGWQHNRVSDTERYRRLALSMRSLLNGPPTCGLHVHVGVPDAEDAIRLLNAFGSAAPLLLALSANSPFFQGGDSGLCSVRTILLERFPRSGTARRYHSYADYVGAIDQLIAAGALADPSYLWWDVRLQPALGTVEVRVMDGQSAVTETVALAALVQSMARLELEEGHPLGCAPSPEALRENRFLAARDGLDARLVSQHGGLTPVRELVHVLIDQCRPHARALGCAPQLDGIAQLLQQTGAERQRAWRRDDGDFTRVMPRLAELFAP